MNTCEQLHRFLDGELNNSEKETFLSHMQQCEQCRITVETWQDVEQILTDIEHEKVQQAPVPSQEAAVRIEQGPGPRVPLKKQFFRWPLAFAAILMVGIGVGVWFQNRETCKDRLSNSSAYIPVSGVVYSSNASQNKTWQPGDKIFTSNTVRALLTIDSARVGVDNNSSVAVHSNGRGNTRIRLFNGQLAAKVEKRNTGDLFVVNAGQYAVRVVGTEFLVQVNDAEIVVAVSHGAVDILKNNHKILRAHTGDRVTLAFNDTYKTRPLRTAELTRMKLLVSEKQEATSQPAPSANKTNTLSPSSDGSEKSLPQNTNAVKKSKEAIERPNYKQWEGWIMQGRYNEARTALQNHLRKAKRDARAWSLLGNCEKRAQNWNDSVAAYKQVIKTGNKAEARTARFKAGIIYQEKLGRHTDAEKMFKEFVASSTSQTLAAQGMLRQARSLTALGKHTQAHALLVKITTQYAGSAVADEAKIILEQQTQQ